MKFKRWICLLLVLCLCLTLVPVKAIAANNVVVCGVDIGIAAGSYMQFTTANGTASDSGYYYNGVDLGATQCFGFARWCQYKLFGHTSYSNATAYYKLSVNGVSDISAGSLTSDNLKAMITAAKPGAHLRTHATSSSSAHSMIITEITDAGFSIVQCNGSNNNEYATWRQNYVGTYTYTWESYVNKTYGPRGIDYIELPNEYPFSFNNNPYGSLDEVIMETDRIVVRGWAADADDYNRAVDVHIVINGTTIGHAYADQYRPDVQTAYGIGEYHGYQFECGL